MNTFDRAERALDAVNEASHAVRVLWITFVLVGTYIGVIIISTSDEQLLRISALTLPILNVPIPILGFYATTPWLFLAFHFYLLSQFTLLSDKVRTFTEYCNQEPPEARDALKYRLTNFPLVQVLSANNDRLTHRVLSLTVWLTVVLFPLWLLLWLQIGFLPFHNEYITCSQRLAVISDALVLLAFWTRVMYGPNRLRPWRNTFNRLLWPAQRLCQVIRDFLRRGNKQTNDTSASKYPLTQDKRKNSGIGFLAAFAFLAVLVSTVFVTFPGERLERTLISYLPESVTCVIENQGERTTCEQTCDAPMAPNSEGMSNVGRTGSPYLVKEGRCVLTGTYALFEEPKAWYGLFHRNLKLNNRVLIGDKASHGDKPNAAIMQDLKNSYNSPPQWMFSTVLGVSLRHRNLNYADFSDSILPFADLRRAHLKGAKFQNAVLDRARLEHARLQGADLSEARLRGATLDHARLQNADLRSGLLLGASLKKTWLQGANLRSAWLQGAHMTEAKLDLADLSAATLRGAELRGTRARGADMTDAQLQAADLEKARLEGANLQRASLKGATLHSAYLIGSNFSSAYLQGAYFQDAWITGANFSAATLGLADFRGVKLKTPPQNSLASLLKVLEKVVEDGWLEGQFGLDVSDRFDKAKRRIEDATETKVLGDNRTSKPTCIADGRGFFTFCKEYRDSMVYRDDLTNHLVEFSCEDWHVAIGLLRRAYQRNADELEERIQNAQCPVVEGVQEELRAIRAARKQEGRWPELGERRTAFEQSARLEDFRLAAKRFP